ncbi:MAG: helix-turn-helix domain-containing protein [Defluviitaleaceae bacterium]|nr:helix-turn-helix domain-containing protein [Defluviitaleaceae bacterium]
MAEVCEFRDMDEKAYEAFKEEVFRKYGKEKLFAEFNEKEVFDEDELLFVKSLNCIISTLVSKRIEMKMTQKELAKKVGITKGAICRIETRAKSPSLETLFKMATHLGMTLTLEDVNRITK